MKLVEILFFANPGEHVVISGGTPLRGLQWKSAEGLGGRSRGAPVVYRAELPAAVGGSFTGPLPLALHTIQYTVSTLCIQSST